VVVRLGFLGDRVEEPMKRAGVGFRQLLGKTQATLGRTVSGTLWAIRLRNQCDAIVGHHLSDGPNPEKNGEAWFAKMVGERASVFIDVGANVGDWAMMFLASMKLRGRGLLFDPGLSAANILRERFRENPTIEVIEAAVSDALGEATFYEERDAGETSSLVANFSQVNATQRRVRLTTVDCEILSRNLTYVDMLKIDAEGYDLRVLRGAEKSLSDHRIGIVQFEYNRPWAEAGSTLGSALTFLRDLDYQVFLLKRSGLYTLEYGRYGEFFSYSNFVAAAPPWLDRLQPYFRGLI